MADKILHKRSLTENSIPTTASLEVGEIAINVNDGKLFVRRSGSFGDTIAPIVTTGITNSGSIIGNFTGSLFGTASFSSLAATASYYDTGSLLITSSVSNATITFTKGNGTTYPITINNVVNAETASFLTGFDQNDYVLLSTYNNFTSSYNTGSFSGSFTGSLFGTASFAEQAATASYVEVAQTASYYDTSSLLVTASISNATITITKGDSTTFNLVVNNVVNAETASYILNAVSSSYASNADLFDNRDSTTFAGTGSNTFDGNQIITGTLNVSSTISGTTALLTTITSSQVVIGSTLYTSKTITSVIGNNIIYNIPTSSYDAAFFDYSIRSGSNARAGSIMAIWSGSSVNYTETTTNDFGSTTGVSMGVVIDGTNLQLSASTTTANWTIKTIIRTI